MPKEKSNFTTLREAGILIGSLRPGKRNRITDVPGVLVGHSTIDTAENKTGVTVIIPSADNPFTHKLIAASYVLNGFGKTQGLVQIEELGTLETPIALTNTLNIGLVHDALVSYMITVCQKEGAAVKSVNPVVGECNDAALNHIENQAVKKEHVFEAIENAGEDFQMGDVGAGKGTVCFGLKGGIGSSSRTMEIDGKSFTIGVLVQTNQGITKDLMIQGEAIGSRIMKKVKQSDVDKGSIMIIVATDLPLSSRQLKRILKRSAVGLSRTGSYIGHGSGEIIIGFSTANVLEQQSPFHTLQILNESKMDIPFRAVAEAVEEAVLNSLFSAGTVTGYSGKTVYSIQEFVEIKDKAIEII